MNRRPYAGDAERVQDSSLPPGAPEESREASRASTGGTAGVVDQRAGYREEVEGWRIEFTDGVWVATWPSYPSFSCSLNGDRLHLLDENRIAASNGYYVPLAVIDSLRKLSSLDAETPRHRPRKRHAGQQARTGLGGSPGMEILARRRQRLLP